MASQKLCACDRTCEGLIGSKLDFVDTVHVPFAALVKSLSNVPASGLWLNPFRGIPKSPRLSRFDVIFLNGEARVQEHVASALILPAHALGSANVKKGDQLRICRAGKIVASEDVLPDGEEPRMKEEGCIRDLKPESEILRDRRPAAPCRVDDQAADMPKPKRGFIARFLLMFFPEADKSNRRRANRLPAPDLVAYYWTGGPPKAYKLGNVSGSGLYLLTEERWLPGTRVVMTLQKAGDGRSDSARSEEISRVESEVVRWGEDGVGFRFVESGFADLNTGEIMEGRRFDKEGFEQFLRRNVGIGSHSDASARTV
jgi:hypothetical protein